MTPGIHGDNRGCHMKDSIGYCLRNALEGSGFCSWLEEEDHVHGLTTNDRSFILV